MPFDVPFVTVLLVPVDVPRDDEVVVPVLFATEFDVPELLVQPSEPFVPVAAE